MKKLIVLLVLISIHTGFLNAQYIVRSETELETLKKLPLEKVYLHSNTSLLFPGEYLYYSLYCINAVTNKQSTISRLAYVELISQNLQTVFRQKVRLSAGRGQGDFFIPVAIPSGNYKLIGYTQWMKNAGISQFFQDDITIINPYRTDQDALLVDKTNTEPEAITSTTDAKTVTPLKEDRSIVLITEHEEYGKREKVVFTPRNFKGSLGYGNYSISVRPKYTMGNKNAMQAREFGQKFLKSDKVISKTVNDSIFLPEQRGELFYGTVLSGDNTPVVDETVIISIPGKDFQLKSAITDMNGNFYTYVGKEYNAKLLIAQTLNQDSEQQKVILKTKPNISYKDLSFANLKIDEEFQGSILERSIHNQIENGYYSVKPDSILSIDKVDPFDGGTPEVIVLDEFTRFPTLRETLLEVVPNLWVKKLESGKHTFWVREKLKAGEDFSEPDPPLVLVDGIFVPDHTSLLEFNARVIEKINILRDPLVLGSKKYLGMVVIETFEGDYLNRLGISNMARQELSLPTVNKNYFNQLYSEGTEDQLKRIPDFRYQLFWLPKFQIGKDDAETSFEFYTSDVAGEYEIVLEGFTTYGKPISIKKEFVVN